jgi:ribosomal protein S18 acetylase RimI-like enzyme
MTSTSGFRDFVDVRDKPNHDRDEYWSAVSMTTRSPIVEIHAGKTALCREILKALPEWFGIPEAIDIFAQGVEGQPMLACRGGGDGAVLGFVSLRVHTAVAAEAYVLGIRRAWHRRGIGRSLFAAAAALLRERGICFLTVKTLAATNPDPSHAATRGFYEAIGFAPIEVFPELWNPGNPCLLMLKPVRLERDATARDPR